MEETACSREYDSTQPLLSQSTLALPHQSTVLLRALHRPTGDGAEEATTETIECGGTVAAQDHPVFRTHTSIVFRKHTSIIPVRTLAPAYPSGI